MVDFASSLSYGCAVTRRVISAVLCFLYLTVVLWVGASHHHGAASRDECVACKWQSASVSDVPLVATFTPTCVTPTVMPTAAAPHYPPDLFAASLSRAPPLTVA